MTKISGTNPECDEDPLVVTARMAVENLNDHIRDLKEGRLARSGLREQVIRNFEQRVGDQDETVRQLQSNIDRRVDEAARMTTEMTALRVANVRYHQRTVELTNEAERLRAEASIRLQITEEQANRIEDLDRLGTQLGVELDEARALVGWHAASAKAVDSENQHLKMHLTVANKKLRTSLICFAIAVCTGIAAEILHLVL